MGKTAGERPRLPAELFQLSLNAAGIDVGATSITAADEWEGFVGVAGDGIAGPWPDASVSTATTLPQGPGSGGVATAGDIKVVSPRAPSWG